MKQALTYLSYLLAITVAEVITALTMVIPAFNPLSGVLCHIAVLMALIVHSALAGKQSDQRLLLSLALAPLVRIISLSMPLANIPQVLWYPIVYSPLLVAAVIVVRIFNFRAGDIGFRLGSVPFQLVIALSGFAIGVVEYFILRPDSLITELTWQTAWLPSLIFVVTTGFVEEFIFRGVMQRMVREVFGRWGIVYISFLFAVLHMGFIAEVGILFGVFDVIFVFVVALFFGWMVKKTGSLFGVTLAHGIANTVLYVVAPFLF